MNKVISGAVAMALATIGSSSAWAEEAAPETGPLALQNFSSTLALTNQYMFRGISNSDGPAVQGSMDWTYSGFFVGAWGSNTEFSDSNLEIDYYGGYRWTWNGVGFTLQGIYYTYPGDHKKLIESFDAGPSLAVPGGVDADYGEFNVGASYTFPGQLAPSVGFNYYYSPDTYGEDGEAHTFQGTFGLVLPAEFNLYGNVGYSDIAGDKLTSRRVNLLNGGLGKFDGYDYTYFSVGVNKTIKGFKLDLGYYGTDESSSLKVAYPVVGGPHNPQDLIDGFVVFSVSRTF